MTEWTFAQQNPSEQLCRIQHFAVTKKFDGGEEEFLITVREYITPPDPAMKFVAKSDKQTNQKSAAYTPIGWGPSLMVALAECIRAINKFPYEP